MKKKYIIGNWKSHKTESEVEQWFFESSKEYGKEKNTANNIIVVLCPPFLYLQQANELCKKYELPMYLGAQDVSPFDMGAYTGEVAASQIREYAKYVIIGHSERRTYFSEDEKLLREKIVQAERAHLIPIYCVQDEKTSIPEGVSFVAYEPVFAIGTGKAESPEKVNEVAREIRRKNKVNTILYGGSVTSDNIQSFLTLSDIDGVLPGSSSLIPRLFWEMIRNASHI